MPRPLRPEGRHRPRRRTPSTPFTRKTDQMMNAKTALLGGLLMLGTACATTEPPAPEPRDPMAEMEAMMALNALGPAHEAFQDQTGIWQASMTAYMDGLPPMEMQGESSMNTLLGGRYLMEEFVSDFMGEPFEGLLLQGYDNLAEEYWTIWIDSTSTGYQLSRGKKRPDGSIELKGTMKDLRTPEGRPVRSVVTHVDDNHVRFEMYDTAPDGSEVLSMEIDYTR